MGNYDPSYKMKPRDPELTRWWGWRDEASYWGLIGLLLFIAIIIFLLV